MGKSVEHPLSKARFISWQQSQFDAAGHYKLMRKESKGPEKKAEYSLDSRKSSLFVSVEFYVPDHAKWRKMSAIADRSVRVQFCFSELGTFDLVAPDDAFEAVKARILNSMEWYNKSCTAGFSKSGLDPNLEHFKPFMRIPALYTHGDEVFMDEALKFKATNLIDDDEMPKMREVLNFALEHLKGCKCRNRLISTICHSFKVEMPEHVKSELKSETKVKKEPGTASHDSAEYVDVTALDGDEADEEEELPFYPTGKWREPRCVWRTKELLPKVRGGEDRTSCPEVAGTMLLIM